MFRKGNMFGKWDMFKSGIMFGKRDMFRNGNMFGNETGLKRKHVRKMEHVRKRNMFGKYIYRKLPRSPSG